MDQHTIIQKMQDHQPVILGEESMKKYAILIPLVQKNNELHLLFEVRAHSMRRQPGEVCFPGGRVDREDEGSLEAAVREAREELNIGSEAITDVFPFGTLVSPFGMTIATFVGFIRPEAIQRPNPAEVEEVFTVPLTYFLSTEPDTHLINVEVKPADGFPYELIANGREYNWQTRQYKEYFYHYEGRVIWGLTARIVNEFIKNLKM
ncbi:NUDIX hydrolase [Jeotgalibacillus proteolyticus]|uniref:Coenzyme A pyrophosphatase n=1 Tax=Jeotgalibacillus proteolyticus TaxID=2082395 RepID=A0A2S5G8J5_9BACL|nr:CoA pyrophosphatase [Jeotgalibacillus proteolyticus]PPA69320.1 coenzyme A pyrophosphatase [Jeotgalibacillus proteolyticus]